ncbi:MAG: hypothetical protein V4506_04260 [Bacteroidota bacterium]
MHSKLLLISFYFPPFNMVASRRWAKHLKYMQKDGVDFHVLTRHFEYKNSPWDKDIESFENKIIRLNYEPKHPYFKTRLPASMVQKILWKLSYLKWKYIKKRENTFIGDDTIGSESLFLEKAIEIIAEKKISNVILTVGPFRFSAILPELKSRFPDVKFSLDYRDYWHDSKEHLPEDFFENEMRLQDKVLKSVDYITVVNEEMKEHFFKKVGSDKSILVLPHCFDPEDLDKFEKKKEQKTINPSQIKFIYGGALYSDMDNYIKLYVHFIQALYASGKITHTSFYVPYKAYEKEFSDVKDKVEFLDYVPSDSFFEILEQNDFVLYFRPDWSPNAFSSKFFELVALRKPILYFGPKSDVSEFIKVNNLGLHFDESSFNDSMKDFIDLLEKKKQINFQYNIEPHTFSYNNKKLYEFLHIKNVEA